MERKPEGAVHGRSFTTEYSEQSNNGCVERPTNAQRVAERLSEWASGEVNVRQDGAVVLPAEDLPLPTLDAAQEVNRRGWQFDGYEGSLAVYRRVDR
jgi:hypothetical protein